MLRILRADSRTATLPIVVLSASVMEWERTAAIDAGATLYWSKPIEFEPFKRGVRAILREARERPVAQWLLGGLDPGTAGLGEAEGSPKLP